MKKWLILHQTFNIAYKNYKKKVNLLKNQLSSILNYLTINQFNSKLYNYTYYIITALFLLNLLLFYYYITYLLKKIKEIKKKLGNNIIYETTQNIRKYKSITNNH